MLGSGVQAVGVTQQVNQFLQQQICSRRIPTTARRTNSTRSIRACSNNSRHSAPTTCRPRSAISPVPSTAWPISRIRRRSMRRRSTPERNWPIRSRRCDVDRHPAPAGQHASAAARDAGQLADQKIAQLNPQITQPRSRAACRRARRVRCATSAYQDLNQLSQIIPDHVHREQRRQHQRL